ncbi:dTDP-4-dehydrorhamnose reductase [Fluviicoccus keumensis]|uniref:dTDP-4-dehydrorhamnose reductase n=1 Tax=Fluviicoccus keumensis TaxID=1435465 RepID=A0A4Q7ZAZ4_9GAMM|nr:dTDP-4-dehydrorhamnose reductase [Fluviicoccus keumensis]
MNVLLIGRNGQIGRELQGRLSALGEVFAPSREQFDLADPDGLQRQLSSIRPDLIVNAAAYTAVEQAESETGLAQSINAQAPEILADAARRMGSLLVHFSTDYVFDGRTAGRYRETDAPNPLNVYGRTKLEGERAIQASGAAHLILRTSWVYGPHGHNFWLTMRRLMRERSELQVVADQWGVPNPASLLAELTVHAIGEVLADRSKAGLYHLSLRGETSWYGFACAIAESCGYGGRVNPISSGAYPSRVTRPSRSVLAADRFAEVFGCNLPDWRTGLEMVCRQPS